MEKEDIKISFDKEYDMFSLFRIGSNVKFSLDIELPRGEIVIDFDFNGHIVGLEFFNASNYFSVLKKIDIGKLKAKMSIQYGSNWAQIFYELSSPELPQPITNSIISPYNKELILEH
jgi:uncharacterized protein YuzE